MARRVSGAGVSREDENPLIDVEPDAQEHQKCPDGDAFWWSLGWWSLPCRDRLHLRRRLSIQARPKRPITAKVVRRGGHVEPPTGSMAPA